MIYEYPEKNGFKVSTQSPLHRKSANHNHNAQGGKNSI
jgi:hypothetical protein